MVGGGCGCGDNHRRRRRRCDPRVCVLHRHVSYGRRRSVSLSRFRFFSIVIIIFITYYTSAYKTLYIFERFFTISHAHRTDSDDLEFYVPAKVGLAAPVITRCTVVVVDDNNTHIIHAAVLRIIIIIIFPSTPRTVGLGLERRRYLCVARQWVTI